ncbi:hypothetical protein MRB53_027862 [Persea americana]|uniref:Uncharacterized protein n=1 Tax=Persea americana TaxID=3435 RepID=A0ACC2KEI8_PERAE|nr:hypothetical protein MRB53_027862 [Persea americana]
MEIAWGGRVDEEARWKAVGTRGLGRPGGTTNGETGFGQGSEIRFRDNGDRGRGTMEIAGGGKVCGGG